jgi:hypothetical protein
MIRQRVGKGLAEIVQVGDTARAKSQMMDKAHHAKYDLYEVYTEALERKVFSVADMTALIRVLAELWQDEPRVLDCLMLKILMPDCNTRQMALAAGVSPMTVSRWIKKYTSEEPWLAFWFNSKGSMAAAKRGKA